MNHPAFDLHCDTALGLMNGKSLFSNDLQIDLSRTLDFPGYAQCFAVFTTSFQENPEELFEKKTEALLREFGKNQEGIGLCRSGKDVSENVANGKASAFLTIEGSCGIGCDPGRLEALYERGFRMVSLSWNEENALTGSCKTGGGLSALGRDFVREAQRLGFLVDVSHISDEAFWDIMKITEGPIVASHSNSRFVRAHQRNLTDEMFSAICQSGGTAGINMYADFVGEDPDLKDVCRHVLHFLELDPSGDHISLGGDLDGSDALPRDFEGVEHYPRFEKALSEQGISNDILRKIFWGNALRLF